MNENKLILQKHSATISISNKLTLQQRKAYNCLLHNAKMFLTKDNRQYQFKINLIRIKEECNLRNTNNIDLKNALISLVYTVIEFNLLEKDKKVWEAFSLLSFAKILNGELIYEFNSIIRETLINPSIFALLDLNIIKGLTSKYSITLYELLEDYKNTSIPKICIDDFNKLMGTENKYNNFSKLREKVIEPAVREINEKTDFKIEWEEFKSGRKITDIKFNHKQTTIEINEELNELKNKFIGKTFTVITKNALGGYSELKYILDGIEQGSQKYLYKIFLLDSTMNRIQNKTENTAEQISSLPYIEENRV